MTGIVDLNLKLQTWKLKLSELEVQEKKLREKISFAEEILKEESDGGIQIQVHDTISISESSQTSLAEAIKGLFINPEMTMTLENIFSHLREKGISFIKPSVYATLSKLKAKNVIEVIQERGVKKLRLKTNRAEGNKTQVFAPPPLPPISGIFPTKRKDAVVQLLKEHGPLTRREIIQKTGFPEGTLSFVLNDKKKFYSKDDKWHLVEKREKGELKSEDRIPEN
jgi:hypothetical protein